MKTSDLHLSVTTLPAAGLVLEGELPAEWAAQVLLDAYEARSGVRLRIEVTLVNEENVLARGSAQVTAGFQCSRTLVDSETEIEVEFAELFLPGDDRHEFKLADGIDSDDLDEEPWLIRGGEIDLEALVREHLILAQDPYPVAEEAAAKPANSGTPAWSSSGQDIDARWAELKKLKLD